MAHQSLDHSEILNVRWATQDPNPVAQGREKRRVEEQAAAAIRAALPEEFVAELEGRDPSATKKRRIEGSFGLRGYEVPEEVWYARGEHAVNPAGRTGGGEMSAQIEGVEGGQLMIEEKKEGGEGIFSSQALEALRGLRDAGGAKVTSKPQTVSAGLGLDYGSDSDDE